MSKSVDAARLWFGEIALEAEDHRLLAEGILLGCGVLCANVSNETTYAMEALGSELVGIYSDTTLPSGGPGGLRFTTSNT